MEVSKEKEEEEWSLQEEGDFSGLVVADLMGNNQSLQSESYFST